MVSSAEDTEVEEAQSPGRREVTIVEDSQSSTIKITRKLDRSLVPKSELPSKSPIKGEKEKKTSEVKTRGRGDITRRTQEQDTKEEASFKKEKAMEKMKKIIKEGLTS